ncbi:MAG: hypothetical protein JHC33_13995, partial [Ignisphaera sp.]|nr:hypothetical protein [Ignisphaera sp.]
SALVLIDARSGQQVGEWKGEFSVVKRFAALLKSCIEGLALEYNLSPMNLLVIIERNSIGKEVVEELLYTDPVYDAFDYSEYMYKEHVGNTDDIVYGFYTSNSGNIGSGKRDEMFNEIMYMVNTYPEYIHGDLLIEDLRTLENKRNGRIEASKNSHDDVVLAYGFTLWVRKYNIKKNILQIEENQLVYGLNPASIKDYLSISLVTRDENLVVKSKANKIIYEYDDSALTHAEKIDAKRNKSSSKEFDFDSFIIM